VFISEQNQSTNQVDFIMADDEDIAALVIDNGSGMCKGVSLASPSNQAVLPALATPCFFGMRSNLLLDLGIISGTL